MTAEQRLAYLAGALSTLKGLAELTTAVEAETEQDLGWLRHYIVTRREQIAASARSTQQQATT
jgi:hypothetical protein